MPRNGSGIYTAPTGTYGVSGTPISSTAYDGFINDLSTELTNSVNVQGTAPMLAPLNMGGYKIINAAPPIVDTDVAIKSYVDNVIPSGIIMAYGVNSSAPTGWLSCDGSSGLSVTTYANLYAVIGYNYGGSGDFFSLPDFRGCFLRGFDNGRHVDPDGTRNPGNLQLQSLLNHFHTIADPHHTHGVTDPTHFHNIPNGALGAGPTIPSGSGFNLNATAATAYASTGISIQAAATGITVGNVSTGLTVENRPTNYPILWIIKT